MNIFLTGMMGSGKSTVGKRLAEKLDFSFVDMDSLIEQKTGKSIPEIFQEEGEPFFRNVEQKLTESPELNRDQQVIATGGGFPMCEYNRKWMQSRGITIWLQVSPETIAKRLKATVNRPLLPSPIDINHIREILSKRSFVYKTANYYIQTDGKAVDEIVRKILKRIPNA